MEWEPLRSPCSSQLVCVLVRSLLDDLPAAAERSEWLRRRGKAKAVL